MHRFTLFLLVLTLSACDVVGPKAPLVGSWTLAEVTTAASVEVEGPIGSTLQFRRNGTYALSSVNGCSGEYVAREDRVWFVDGVCTLIGAPVESDLAQMLFLGGDTPSFELGADGDLYIEVFVTQPTTDPGVPNYLRFRFEPS